MKKASLQYLLNLMNYEIQARGGEQNTDFVYLDVRNEIQAELNRDVEIKAKKAALYDQAKEPVLEALRIAEKPATVAEIFAECEKELPEGFTKNQVNYGLTHYWTEEVEKIGGKVNSYRLKEGA